MNSGLYIWPGAPATCSAAVRAIWLARPGTSVSKVRAGFSRLREGSGACGLDARAPASICGTGMVGVPGGAKAVDGRPGAESRACSAMSRRTGLPASSASMASIRPAYWLRIQSSLNRLGTRKVTTAPESP